MAAVKEIEKAIKSHQYVHDSIAYVFSPENRNGDEKCCMSTCINCNNNGADGLSLQFRAVRFAFDKDDKILSHHYVQSFSPNEKITPELAHKIGVELAERVAPGFQVIVATHIDKDHLHTHFIINSVNYKTGMKWKGDLRTRMNMRAESDKLCKKYGLTTIDTKSGLRGIDQTTQKLAEKGKSWKVDLCKALDEAVKICNTKQEFISFMKIRGFEITRYTDRHITFQKSGEKKIRADTLAKQFGDVYKKEYLEKKMGFYRPPKKSEAEIKPKPKKHVPSFRTEFEKYEQNYFRKNPPPVDMVWAKKVQGKIKKSEFPLLLLMLEIIKMVLRKKRRAGLDRKYRAFHTKAKPQKQYRMKKTNIREALKRYETAPAAAGNILYRDLVKAQGDNYRVRIALSAVPKLYAYPFFFSVKLYKDNALVTIKAKDKKLLQKALEVKDISVLEKHDNYYTAKSEYDDLKKRAEQFGVKVEFLVIKTEMLKKLDNEKERFAAFPPENGKIKIAFLPQNKDFILHRLYPERYDNQEDIFSVARNSKVNTMLKSDALLNGKKLRYRTLTRVEVEELHKQTGGQDMFAVFSKGEKYNVAYKEDDEKKIESIIGTQSKSKFRRK